MEPVLQLMTPSNNVFVKVRSSGSQMTSPMTANVQKLMCIRATKCWDHSKTFCNPRTEIQTYSRINSVTILIISSCPPGIRRLKTEWIVGEVSRTRKTIIDHRRARSRAANSGESAFVIRSQLKRPFDGSRCNKRRCNRPHPSVWANGGKTTFITLSCVLHSDIPWTACSRRLYAGTACIYKCYQVKR